MVLKYVATITRPHLCEWCGERWSARVTAPGTGSGSAGWHDDQRMAYTEAAANAERAALATAGKIDALVPCPRCGRRSAATTRQLRRSNVLAAVGTVALPLAFFYALLHFRGRVYGSVLLPLLIGPHVLASNHRHYRAASRAEVHPYSAEVPPPVFVDQNELDMKTYPPTRDILLTVLAYAGMIIGALVIAGLFMAKSRGR